jgi:hypothetical protein
MKNKERIFYVVAITLLLLMFWSTCETQKSIQKASAKSTEDFKKRINKDSSTIYRQELTIVNQANKIKELKELAIKDPELIVKTQTQTVVKTNIQLDTVIINNEPYIKLPKDFHKKDKWFSIDGTISRLGVLQIDSLVTTANLTYAIADTARKGILNKIAGKKDKVLSLKIDNPNMKITGMSNIYIKEEKKWWQTTAAKVGLGFVLGVGMIAAIN